MMNTKNKNDAHSRLNSILRLGGLKPIECQVLNGRTIYIQFQGEDSARRCAAVLQQAGIAVRGVTKAWHDKASRKLNDFSGTARDYYSVHARF